jgi:hypothetical protein
MHDMLNDPETSLAYEEESIQSLCSSVPYLEVILRVPV